MVAVPSASQNWLALPCVLAEATSINTETSTMRRNTMPVRLKYSSRRSCVGETLSSSANSCSSSPRVGAIRRSYAPEPQSNCPNGDGKLRIDFGPKKGTSNLSFFPTPGECGTDSEFPGHYRQQLGTAMQPACPGVNSRCVSIPAGRDDHNGHFGTQSMRARSPDLRKTQRWRRTRAPWLPSPRRPARPAPPVQRRASWFVTAARAASEAPRRSAESRSRCRVRPAPHSASRFPDCRPRRPTTLARRCDPRVVADRPAGRVCGPPGHRRRRKIGLPP